MNHCVDCGKCRFPGGEQICAARASAGQLVPCSAVREHCKEGLCESFLEAKSTPTREMSAGADFLETVATAIATGGVANTATSAASAVSAGGAASELSSRGASRSRLALMMG